jgi:allantoinase
MSRLDCIVRGASVVTPEEMSVLDLGIAEGRIVALSPGIRESAEEEIIAAGNLLVPGMIDAHVHFNEPGRTTWEGFATGSAAAAAGGVTTVFDMPLNSTPATLTPEDFDAKHRCAAERSLVRTRLWGGLVPGNLHHLAPLRDRGVVGFKAFMSSSGIEDFPRADTATLRAGMKVIAGLGGMCLAVHAEDEALTARLAAEYRRKGRQDFRAFAASRPIEAEMVAIREILELAGETGCPLHIVHVSAAESVALILQAKARGMDVTVETCPHYLALTLDDMEHLGALAKCAPPLRRLADRESLWGCVIGGEIDTIGSDHSPCPPELKTGRSFADAWGGISGVQHALPFTYSEGLARGAAPLLLARLLSETPARRFHLESGLGRVRIGAPADLCLLRPGQGRRIELDGLRDRHRHSPYVGRQLAWTVRRTWINGRTVFDADEPWR